MNKLQSLIFTFFITALLTVMWVLLLPQSANAQLLKDWDPGYKINKEGKAVAPFSKDYEPKVSEDNELFDLFVTESDAESADLSQPHRTDKQMGDWASRVFVENFNLNQSNLRTQLSRARPYFSDRAWKQLSDFLKQRDRLANIQKGVLSMKMLERHDPRIVKTEQRTKNYSWIVRLPILMELSVAKGAATREVDFFIQIMRVKDGPDSNNVIVQGIRETQPEG